MSGIFNFWKLRISTPYISYQYLLALSPKVTFSRDGKFHFVFSVYLLPTDLYMNPDKKVMFKAR
ncbi:hypothetical protein PM03_14990 [Thalassobacter stenotrophicus]|nr:hypothetical protein PM03_14990 [Thalassobacter stenotrophicus]